MSWGVAACHTIAIRRDISGHIGLAFAEGQRDVPFDIARVYWLWGMQPGDVRGTHAHKALQQVYLCLNGTVDIELCDDMERRTVRLDHPDEGLYLGPMVWRSVRGVAKDSVLLVLASAAFDESDYYRDQHEYVAAAMARRQAQGVRDCR